MNMTPPAKISHLSNEIPVSLDKGEKFKGLLVSNGKSCPDDTAETKKDKFDNFILQDIISRFENYRPVLTEDEKKALASKKLPPICTCRKVLRPPESKDKDRRPDKANSIELIKSDDSASYGGLITCGLVWKCPICGQKISHVRCEEIKRAKEIWEKKKGHHVLLVTLTIPHYFRDSLADTLDGFSNARRHLKKQDPLKKQPFDVYRELKEKYRIKGTITGLETTWSERNGWHPHSHDLFFVEKSMTGEEVKIFQKELTQAWIYACIKAKINLTNRNLEDMQYHSVHVEKCESAEEYIAKYGIKTEIPEERKKEILGYYDKKWSGPQEITKSRFKEAKQNKDVKGLTPWEIAWLAYERPEKFHKCASLFMEYGRAFKGKRFCFWSKGFKKELLNDEGLTDQEAADLNGEGKSIGSLGLDEWTKVLRYKLRGKVLRLVCSGNNIHEIKAYIKSHDQKPYDDSTGFEAWPEIKKYMNGYTHSPPTAT